MVAGICSDCAGLGLIGLWVGFQGGEEREPIVRAETKNV